MCVVSIWNRGKTCVLGSKACDIRSNLEIVHNLLISLCVFYKNDLTITLTSFLEVLPTG